MKAILAAAITAGASIYICVGTGPGSTTPEEPRNCWSYRQPQDAPLPRPQTEEPPQRVVIRGINPALPRQPKEIHGVGICGCCCGIGGPDLRADALTVGTFTGGERAPLTVDLTAVRAEHPSHPSGWKRVCAECSRIPAKAQAKPTYCSVPKPLPPTKK